jgi:HK97 family phage prohead protease
MGQAEIRQIPTEKIEVRAVGDGQTKTVGGYAVRYNTPTLITDRWGDQFLEEISAGAFDKSLNNRNQKALWNHDSSKPLGSVSASTLRFNADASGLNYEVDLPNTSYGNDAFESIQRGDVSGSSFGFVCNNDVWSKVQYEGREVYKRSIVDAELFEVSPCTFPAYDSSEISVRSLEDFKKKEKDNTELRKKLLIQTFF